MELWLIASSEFYHNIVRYIVCICVHDICLYEKLYSDYNQQDDSWTIEIGRGRLLVLYYYTIMR